jgi:hypothetical protein
MEEEKKPKSIVEEAKERFKYAEDAYSTAYQRAIEDTKFAWGDSENGWQWPEDIVHGRKGDNKVCLTINLTAQHCNQIINQIRANRPTGKVIPVDNGADKKTAEILEGLIRNIQSYSAADDAHDTAAEHAVYGGFGYWRVITEYESPESLDQIIKIKQIPNFKLVYIDPDRIEQDGSDAEWGFVFEDVKKKTFERQHPNIKDVSSWEVTTDSWVTKETIRVAEYFWCEYESDKALLLDTGTSILESKLPEGVNRNGMTLVDEFGNIVQILKERDTERKQWKWCKLAGGYDKPIEEAEWAGSYLPIVSIVGKEINIDGEKLVKGQVRDMKDAARMANYAYSETVQTLALQNKIPYTAAAEAIAGHEQEWGSANNENKAYLPFNAYDENGQPLPTPSRQAPPSMATAQAQFLQMSVEQMRGVSGQHNASMGIRSEASSGVGIQRLKQQSEVSTFHFPDNLARGLRYEIKLLIDLIPKIMDTKRIVRILGLDGKSSNAILDPESKSPYIEQDIGEEDIQRIFNPTLGRYDAAIDTGPSYQTQRQEGYNTMMEMASRSPALMGVAGDLIMQNADYPGADKIAERMKKALPPELQDQKAGGAEQQLAQITNQAQQMGQQIQVMTQQLQEQQVKLQQAESEDMKAQIGFQVQRQKAELDAAIEERKMIQDNERIQRKMMYDAQIALEKIESDAQIAREKMAMDMQLAREKAEHDKEMAKINAGIDMSGKMMQSHQETCAKVKINEDNNDTKRDIAELDAFVKLETAGMQNQALETDVNMDLKEDISKDIE